MRVLKRDQRTVVPFNETEIQRALLLGFGAIGNTLPDMRPIVQNILRKIHLLCKETVTVDEVLDCMEDTLMGSGYHDVAKAFILYRQKRADTRNARLIPDATALKDYIHVAKYAKWVDGHREIRSESVDRLESMHVRKFPEHEKAIAKAFAAVRRFEVSPSGRSMQFGGKAIEKHNARMYNCCFTHIDRIDVFSKIFYLLLCGCGVGYSVQWRHVDKLPRLKTIDEKKVRHWVVKDSIEGWGDAIEMLMASFFMTGEHFEPAYHEIRPEGARLKTSGGKAPGHLPLKKAIEAIRKILTAAQGRKLKPIECHDILCHLSIAVLSGGIRRSAMIALFSPEDTEMMYAKAKPSYDPERGVNKQREMANNSAVFLREAAKREVFNRCIRVADENFGCPGFLFVEDLDHGTNPCGEIGLWPVLWEECISCKGTGEKPWDVDSVIMCKQCSGAGAIRHSGFAFCNLTSINCALFQTEYDFYRAAQEAAIIGTLQATYTDFPYLGPVSQKIAQRDALLGVSLCGIMDCPSIALDAQVQKQAARVVVETNRVWAAKLGINQARSSTTVKPEGTNSLAMGCIASGHHAHHAMRYLRRVTGNVNEGPVQEFMRVNPHMVEYKPNGDVALVFPVQAREGAICIDNVTAMDFVSSVMSTYENWVVPGGRGPLTHNVSCTVTLKPGEREDVVEYIWQNRHRVAAMSFVPHVLDKLYAFAPREAITTPEDETYWNRLIEGYKAVDWANFYEPEDTTNRQMAASCTAGGCDD
jgi:ribonucleoside-diphosphate reductase alpha chain